MAKRKKPSTAPSPANEPSPAASRRSKRPTRAKTEKMEDPASPLNEQAPVMASSPANEAPAAKIENVEDAASPPSTEQAPVVKMEITGGSNTVDQQRAEDKPESSNGRKGLGTDSAEIAEEPDEEAMAEAEMDEMAENIEMTDSRRRRRGRKAAAEVEVANEQPPQQDECDLLEPFTDKEARENWPHRYQIEQKGSDKASSSRSNGNDSDELMKAQRHYRKAKVDGIEYKLNDNAFVQSEEGKPDFICKIIELFRGIDKVMYFRACWYYRAEDTVISEVHRNLVKDEKRVFVSEVQDDNNLDCLVKPLKIARIPFDTDAALKQSIIDDSDFYYDQMYLLPHCTFIGIEPDHVGATSKDSNLSAKTTVDSGLKVSKGEKQIEMTMLDLYAGCGAMSTGLCLGSNIEGVKLVTKWAVDMNKHACDSLRINHPETEVRNESAEDFLKLLEEWKLICASYSLIKGPSHPVVKPADEDDIEPEETEQEDSDDELDGSDVFEVEEVIGICFGTPDDKDRGLYFKVHWKGYTSDYDTWEPYDCLSGCPAKLKDFILKAYQKMLLPLPGSVDVVCGGPPCQGISGFNRFRKTEDPLSDPKNQQMRVYMDIVQYLKPRFVLMENVVDLFRFCGAHLGRYAFARLVQMRYQARLGLIAAGAYGLAQYRMRAFLWAALESEKLPQFPLPTHDVVVRGNVPVEFQECFVGFEDGSVPQLQNKLFLEDVISDLPPVTNNHAVDVMDYSGPALTDFQRAIRLSKDEMPGFLHNGSVPDPPKLFDHRPLRLNVDDFTRVCQIPRKKGANFRDLPGVMVTNNVAELDTSVTRQLLESGKPLVPDYAISFVKGTSSKPFGRIWWDETVPTVVTRAEPHNQIILHPIQDRVLTIRENARLQGFPDFYKLKGPVKERYMQVGNAVAIPVARALGHSLALAAKGISGSAPLYYLPQGFPFFPVA